MGYAARRTSLAKGIALPLGALIVTLGLAAPAAAPDAYQLYARARAVWAGQQYPPLIAYTVRVTVDDGNLQRTNHYHAVYDASGHRVYFIGVSDEESANPHVPDGLNWSVVPRHGLLKFLSQKVQVGKREDAVDYLGVPILTPTYSFGMAPALPAAQAEAIDRRALVEQVRRDFNDPLPPEKARLLDRASGDPPEIAHVVATDRTYDVALVGTDTVGGRNTYHLALRPARLSNRYRLRELWIDAQTYATVRLVSQGNFTDERVPWLVTFGESDGVTYIASESALRPITVGHHTYAAASVAFEDIAPSKAPNLLWRAPVNTGNLLVEPAGAP